jgi:hypothetical protein
MFLLLNFISYLTLVISPTLPGPRSRRGRDRMVVVLQIHVQSVPITTKVVISNPTHD